MDSAFRLPSSLLNDIPKLDTIDLSSQRRSFRHGKIKPRNHGHNVFSIIDRTSSSETNKDDQPSEYSKVDTFPKYPCIGQNEQRKTTKILDNVMKIGTINTMEESDSVKSTKFSDESSIHDMNELVIESKAKMLLNPGVGGMATHHQVNDKSISSPSTYTDENIIVSRREVALLKEKMHFTLTALGAKDPHHEYPDDIRSLLNLAEEEHIIYDHVFTEMVRQVSVNMSERGQILNEIRQRYANMFGQIPKVVKNVHTELCAERVKNHRLCQELLRIKDSMRMLSKKLGGVQNANDFVSSQGNAACAQLLDVLAHASKSDQTLADYQDVYNIHKNRLESQISLLDRDKKEWMDIALQLALRIGFDLGLPEIAFLQKFEYGRLRATNHMISLHSEQDRLHIQQLVNEFEAWVLDISKISADVEREDINSRNTLQKMLHEIRNLQKLMKIDDATEIRGIMDHQELKSIKKTSPLNEHNSESLVPPCNDSHRTPDDILEQNHTRTELAKDQALNMLNLERRRVDDVLKQLLELSNIVSVRYTSDKDECVLAQLTNSQRKLVTWLEISVMTVERASRNSPRNEYIELLSSIKSFGTLLHGWITKLKVTVRGDNGVATGAIALQNQLEDRHVIASCCDDYVSIIERKNIQGHLVSWSEQLSIMLVQIQSNAFGVEKSSSFKIKEWISKLMGELNSETQVRSEANVKLHKSLIRWMLQFLVKRDHEKPTETWDKELSSLEKQITDVLKSMTQLSTESQLLSDDRKDLLQVAQSYADSWIKTAHGIILKRQNRTSDGDNPDLTHGSRVLDALDALESPCPSHERTASDNDTLDLGSTYLDKGKNGQGSYPDVTDVLPVPPEEFDRETLFS